MAIAPLEEMSRESPLQSHNGKNLAFFELLLHVSQT
jgi:hypothetical protein